ncbi:AAA family ATPase [Salinarimonas soli]|uniref:AAA family ATPase n=1 Tax=Salinarimonas soli TaxID=1638099 RepID=A0A5B2VHJ7_9HYPH|nr:AAA family ATPase [Salinarimonas soli]
MGRELERLAAGVSRARGREDGHRQREAVLERDIALAKARIAVKGDVEAFIEAVQAEASRRNVAAFETLLTALVQEVLPGEKPVVLDLTTERGLAALDIGLARPDGSREDVLEDNGGALTNVVGMALRLIAVVKAGVGRFLALDEADCWIAPDRVPAFYRVLEDGAARLGVQCLAISHHDLSAFEGRFRVARVAGLVADGVTIAGPAEAAAWSDDMPGLRSIRLVDVQAFADATLPLGPGVNALIGPNNRGKSTIIRALRAVFYGEGRDALVRAGAGACTVELGLARGRILRFNRTPKRTPVNLWSLHEVDGSVVEEDGTRFETGGRAVPDWVERLCGIVKVEGLDVHVAHQKFPVFLLGEPASKRSAVLSIGQESAYLREMLAIHRERTARDQTLVRLGERELGEIRDALARLGDLAGIEMSLAEERDALANLHAGARRVVDLEGAHARLTTAVRRLAAARGRSEALLELPGPEALAGISERLAKANARSALVDRLIAASRRSAGASARAAALAELPDDLPPLRDAGAADRSARELARLRKALDAARGRAGEAERRIAAIKGAIEGLIEAGGGLCPACGAPVDAAALLGDHTHPQEAA